MAALRQKPALSLGANVCVVPPSACAGRRAGAKDKAGSSQGPLGPASLGRAGA